MAFIVKYYVGPSEQETLIADRYEFLERAKANALAASVSSQNLWAAASVWVAQPDGSEFFLTEYVDGRVAA